MIRLDPRLIRALLAAAAGCAVAAVAVSMTGGVSFQIGGLVIRSHNPVRPVVGAILLVALALTGGKAAVAGASEWWRLTIERAASAVAALLAVAIVVVGFRWGAFVAGGSDSYCYLNQAELLARGAVHDFEPLAADPSFPGTFWSFVPAGHMPLGGPVPALVPICPSGYPLMMAGARLAFGRSAMFWITPLMGGVAVYLVFLLGRRLAGPAAGLLGSALTASSPTFLFQLAQPMNDVSAAAIWCGVLVAAVSGWRTDIARAAAAGLLTAAALVVRPNLVPLAAVAALGVALVPPGRTLRQRLAAAMVFGLAAAPGPVVVMALQRAMYGSALTSGYGDLGALFSLSHLWPNLLRYPRWLAAVHTPLIALAAAAPWVMRVPGARRQAAWLLIFAAATLACYLPYVVFDAWWYTRFLLPAILPLLALTAAVLVTWIQRAPAPLQTVLYAVAGAALVMVSLNTAVQRDAFRVRDLEWRFRSAGEYAARLPPEAAFITLHQSGSIRFYSGRSTIGWEDIESGRLDGAVAFLERNGRRPYLLFEPWEEPRFKARFAGDRLGALNWPPIAEIDSVRIYDPADYDRHRRGETIRTDRIVSDGR